MIARTAAATLERLAGQYPVVALTGQVYGGEQRQSRGAHAAIPWQELSHTDI